MAVILKCSDCEGKFRWDTAVAYPSHCPMCGAYVGHEDNDGVVTPFISLRKNKSADDVYRASERGAEHRIELAAAATGLDKSEFADMKMTNAKDNLREGDIAAPTIDPGNVAQQMIDARPGVFGFQGGDAAAAFATTTSVGDAPRAGSKAVGAMKSMHSQIASAIASEALSNPNRRQR